jgi:hypothetical protein
MLLDNLNVDVGLIAELFGMDVLTPREKDQLSSANPGSHKIESLLSMLSRKSPEQFELFLKALHRTGQGRIAFALLGKNRHDQDASTGNCSVFLYVKTCSLKLMEIT